MKRNVLVRLCSITMAAVMMMTSPGIAKAAEVGHGLSDDAAQAKEMDALDDEEKSPDHSVEELSNAEKASTDTSFFVSKENDEKSEVDAVSPNNKAGEESGEEEIDGFEDTYGDFTYTTYDVLDHTYVTITKYNGSSANVTIPDTISGYFVKKIAYDAFKGNSAIKTVIISMN